MFNEDVLNSTSIDFLLNTNIEKTVKKTLLKGQVCELYLSLLNCVRPLCLSSYCIDDRPKPLPQEEQIQSIITKVDNISNINLSSIQTQLTTLQSTVDSLTGQTSSTAEHLMVQEDPDGKSSSDDINLNFNDENVLKSVSDIPHIDEHIPDFIGKGEISEITNFLDGCNFAQEAGYGTIKYGESYNYNGSRNKSIPMPQYLIN